MIKNEFGKLKTVLVGDPQPYLSKKSAKQIFLEKNIISDLESILKKFGVKVLKPEYVKGLNIKQSLWCRDTSIKIDDQVILLQGSNKRENEYKTLLNVHKNYIIQQDTKIKLEGGDIFQDENIVLVGLNDRTNRYGFNWIKNIFPNKKCIGIDHSTLHLDCCLAILPDKIILYSNRYIVKLPSFLKNNYKCINIDNLVDNRFDPNLATNFIYLDKNTIVCTDQPKFKKLRNFLNELGFKIIHLEFHNLWKFSGGVRCLVQAVERI